MQAARVHLAIPRPTVFVREQQRPSASVLVSLYPGRMLDAGQVSAILHLVASSVPELEARDVTVVDQSGNLLSGSDDRGARQRASTPAQLKYLHAVEASYAARIENILEPIVGRENVRAQVAAALDFSQVEQTSETFKPNPAPQEAVDPQPADGGNGDRSTRRGPAACRARCRTSRPARRRAPLTAPLRNRGGPGSRRRPAASSRPTRTVRTSSTTRSTRPSATPRARSAPSSACRRRWWSTIGARSDASGKATSTPLQRAGDRADQRAGARGDGVQPGARRHAQRGQRAVQRRKRPWPVWKPRTNGAVALHRWSSPARRGQSWSTYGGAGLALLIALLLVRSAVRDLARAGQRPGPAAPIEPQLGGAAAYSAAPEPGYEADLRAVKDWPGRSRAWSPTS